MIKNKDIEILHYLRNNARMKATDISRETKIPVTTIYDRLRHNERKGIVKRHVTLLDFAKMGFAARANLLIFVDKDYREQLRKFLLDHNNINSLYSVDLGTGFLAEGIFSSERDIQLLKEEIEHRFKPRDIRVLKIVEELKKEEFFNDINHIKLLNI